MSDEDNVINVEIEYENRDELNLNATPQFPKNKINITIKEGDNIDDNTFKDLTGDILITEIKFEINYPRLENLDKENEILNKIISFFEELNKTGKSISNIKKIEFNFEKTKLKYIQDKAFSDLLTNLNNIENKVKFEFTFPEYVEKFGNDVFTLKFVEKNNPSKEKNKSVKEPIYINLELNMYFL